MTKAAKRAAAKKAWKTMRSPAWKKAHPKRKKKNPSKKHIKTKGNKQVIAKACPKCKKLIDVGELKKHISYHRRAKKASQRNIQSEKQYVKKLKKQNHNSLIFQTGKEVGVPDIVLYKNSKLIFYEIKPTKKESEKRSKLKKTQVEWIQKNCFPKRNEVYVVFYKGPTRKLTFSKIQLTRKNIGMYS